MNLTNQKRSSSLGTNLNRSSLIKVNDIDDESSEISSSPLKSLDYGIRYLPTLSLAVWLLQWSHSFKCKQLIGVSAQNNINTNMALKLQHLNANVLVGSVYLCDGRDLWHLVKTKRIRIEKRKAINMVNTTDEETMTQVSSTTESPRMLTATSRDGEKPREMRTHRDTSSSSTLDISSLTDYQVNIEFSAATVSH